MNIDDGRIRLWDELSQEEKESGRWVKLKEGEYEYAQTLEQAQRTKMLNEIFNNLRGKHA